MLWGSHAQSVMVEWQTRKAKRIKSLYSLTQRTRSNFFFLFFFCQLIFFFVLHCVNFCFALARFVSVCASSPPITTTYPLRIPCEIRVETVFFFSLCFLRSVCFHFAGAITSASISTRQTHSDPRVLTALLCTLLYLRGKMTRTIVMWFFWNFQFFK